MLLHNDVVTDGKTEPSSFPGRLGRKERVEQLFLNPMRNTGAIVAYADFDPVTEIFGSSRDHRRVVALICLRFTLRRSVKAVGNQVEQHPGNLLGEQISLTCGQIKGPFQGDVEALLLSPRPVIGQIETFIDESIDIHQLALSRPLT
jgi:hypothetical protein